MSERRGEVPFVAFSIGRLDDPRAVFDLADDLAVPWVQAIGYLVLLDACVLKRGDVMTGKIPDHTARHIARELGWPGKPEKLIAALIKAKALGKQRSTFYVPRWLDTPTGEYASQKAENREHERTRKATQRAAKRAAELVAAENGETLSHGTSQGQTGDVPLVSHGKSGHKEKEVSKGAPGQDPPAPSRSEGELASRRWAEIEKAAKRLDNPEACSRAAARIPEADWPRVLWVLAGCPGWTPRSRSRKHARLHWEASRILSKRVDLEFRDEWAEKLKAEARPKNGHAKPAAAAPSPDADRQARRAAALTFLLEQLADIELSDAKKAKARSRYEAEFGAIPSGEGEGLQSAPPTN